MTITPNTCPYATMTERDWRRWQELTQRWHAICAESKRRSAIYGHGKGFSPEEKAEHERVLFEVIEMQDAHCYG